MTYFKKISKLLKRDRNQRILYGAGLLFWIFILISEWRVFSLDNPTRFQFIGVVIIPGIILLGQLVFNNKIIWFLFIGLVSIYSLLILWNFLFLEILIDFHRDYAPNSFWTFKKILKSILFFGALTLINWTVWKMKPQKNALHNKL